MREFFISKRVSHLLQREMTGRLLPPMLERVMEFKVFVIRGFHSDNKERRIQDVCHMRV